MKTAISIPDSLFEKAENTAKKLGISRSRLFSKAVEEFIRNYHTEEITKQLNRIYDKESGSLDSSIQKMQIESLRRDDW